MPQNLTLVLVGNFKSKPALALAEKYFGRLKKGEGLPPDVVTLEQPQKAEKRFYAEAETNPNVDIYWHTPAFGHKDTYPLSVLAQVLSTRTGRLHKELVLGKKLATDTGLGRVRVSTRVNLTWVRRSLKATRRRWPSRRSTG